MRPDGGMGIFEILITGDKNNLRSRQEDDWTMRTMDRPSRSGILISLIIISGTYRLLCELKPSRPLEASPTIAQSGSLPLYCLAIDLRVSSLSSIITILYIFNHSWSSDCDHDIEKQQQAG